MTTTTTTTATVMVTMEGQRVLYCKNTILPVRIFVSLSYISFFSLFFSSLLLFAV